MSKLFVSNSTASTFSLNKTINHRQLNSLLQ